MSTFKVQHIRECTQCGETQPLRCKKCIKHPERKPRIIELFDWPPILETAPCGCLLIQCQAPGCSNKKWRYPRLHSSTGKATAKTFCCGSRCAAAVANAVRMKSSVTVECTYCGKPRQIPQSTLKLRRHVFCQQSHFYLWCRKMAHEAREAAITAIDNDEKEADLWCHHCHDIVTCTLKNEQLHIYNCASGHVLNVGAIEKHHIRELRRVAVNA